jgi:hypothetical protein
MLLRALGETRCRACAHTKVAVGRGGGGDNRLADEVAAALRRRFES